MCDGPAATCPHLDLHKPETSPQGWGGSGKVGGEGSTLQRWDGQIDPGKQHRSRRTWVNTLFSSF